MSMAAMLVYQDRLNKFSFSQPIEVHQLAKLTFRSRYAHTPFGSAPVPILLS